MRGSTKKHVNKKGGRWGLCVGKSVENRLPYLLFDTHTYTHKHTHTHRTPI